MKINFDLNDKESQMEALEEFVKSFCESMEATYQDIEYWKEYGYIFSERDADEQFEGLKRNASEEMEQAIDLLKKSGLSDGEILKELEDYSELELDLNDPYGRPMTDEADRFSLGEQEDDLKGISGEVNGKPSKDILKELTAGLTDDEIEEATRNIDCYFRVQDGYLYYDMSGDWLVERYDGAQFLEDILERVEAGDFKFHSSLKFYRVDYYDRHGRSAKNFNIDDVKKIRREIKPPIAYDKDKGELVLDLDYACNTRGDSYEIVDKNGYPEPYERYAMKDMDLDEAESIFSAIYLTQSPDDPDGDEYIYIWGYEE